MMLAIRRTSKFKKDYKRCIRRGYEIGKLGDVVRLLANGMKLEAKYRDHTLSGEFDDCRECHIEPDWLMIYQITGYELVLIRTGTHADLFE